MIQVKKAFMKVLENNGINGFPCAMQSISELFLKGSDPKITDKIALGESFAFVEGDIFAKMREYDPTIHVNIPRFYKKQVVGSGAESNFKDSIVIDDKYYGATADGIAISLDFGKTWTWKKPVSMRTHDVVRLKKDESSNDLYALLSNKTLYKSSDDFNTATQVDFHQAAIDAFLIDGQKIIIGTRGAGIFYSPNDDVVNGRPWIHIKQKRITKYTTLFMWPYQVIDPVGINDDHINDIGKDGGKYIVLSNNGINTTSDWDTFERQMFIDLTPIPADVDPNPPSGGEGGSTPPPSTPSSPSVPEGSMTPFHRLRATNSVTFAISNGLGFYQSVGGSPFTLFSKTINSVTPQVSIFNSPFPFGFQDPFGVSPIRDIIFIGNRIWAMIEGTDLYVSYDDRVKWYQRSPASGYAGFTPVCLFGSEKDGSFCVGADKGVIFPIDKDIKIRMIAVKKKEDKNPKEVRDEFTYNDLAKAIGDPSNAKLSEWATIEGSIGNYIFFMVKTPTEREGEFVKTWYLVGFESRYNEMKEVAAEFGVTNN